MSVAKRARIPTVAAIAAALGSTASARAEMPAMTEITGIGQAYNITLDCDGRLIGGAFDRGTLFRIDLNRRIAAALTRPDGDWQPLGVRFHGADRIEVLDLAQGTMSRVHGVAADCGDRLWISILGKPGQAPGSVIVRDDVTGTVEVLSAAEWIGPVQAFPTTDGSTYIVDAYAATVFRWTASDRSMHALDSRIGRWAPAAPVPETEFAGPHGVALGLDGRLYVADTKHNRVQRFDRDGRFAGWLGLRTDGRSAKWSVPLADAARSGGLGALASPIALAFDGSGNLLVLANGSGVVQAYDRDGEPLGCWNGAPHCAADSDQSLLKGPHDLVISGARACISDTGNRRILCGPSDLLVPR